MAIALPRKPIKHNKDKWEVSPGPVCVIKLQLLSLMMFLDCKFYLEAKFNTKLITFSKNFERCFLIWEGILPFVLFPPPFPPPRPTHTSHPQIHRPWSLFWIILADYAKRFENLFDIVRQITKMHFKHKFLSVQHILSDITDSQTVFAEIVKQFSQRMFYIQ